MLAEWLQEISLNWAGLLKVFAQLAILVAIVYVVYNRFIRRSHAEQLLKGLFVILLMFVAAWGVAKMFNFFMLEVIFGASIQLLIIGLIVIFQPELRRMLLFLGQPELFGRQTFAISSEERKAEYLVHELTESVRFLSKSKTGALIVLETPHNPGGNYLEVGTTLDARLSTELLLTIFHHKTPLHDGAVVINAENRITAAGVLLPLTEDPKLSWQYGTRHRAAIGLTEISDSWCIVVSEETGTISFAHGGMLEKMGSADDLKKRLERIYHVQAPSDREHTPTERFSGFFSTESLPSSLQKIFTRRNDSLDSETAKPLPKPGSNGPH